MNIRSSKSPTPDIVAEASAWFIEFRAGEASASDRARFYEWLHRSPEHIQVYLEIAEGWAELPTSDPQGRFDIEALIERARESHDENVIALASRSAAQTVRPHPALRTWAASLAGIVALSGIALWLLVYEANTYRTGVGEQRVVRLTDGSTMELNAISTVRVRLSENSREIDLKKGQALFRVTKDKARPFIVRSGQTAVRAVGTQFDVYRKHTGTVVTVLEGRVAVLAGKSSRSAARPLSLQPSEQAAMDRSRETQESSIAPIPAPMVPGEIFLVAGEQVTVPTNASTNGADVKPRRADVVAATAWVQNQLIFNETPLADVAEEFNRYSTRQLVISDPELASMGVSGVYSSTRPDSLLGFLRAQPNVQLSETDEEIRVSLPERK